MCPGAANCRLVGSRWKYIERPVDGDVVYTGGWLLQAVVFVLNMHDMSVCCMG